MTTEEPDEGSSAADAGPGVLPQPVHRRVVELAAAVLPDLPPDQLPLPLRRVATFTPARRARLGRKEIAAALEADAQFRDRVATAVRAAQAELAGQVANRAAPPTADPVEVAALAYLLRPAGWIDLVGAVTERAERAKRSQSADAGRAELARTQGRLDETRAELHRARQRNREQLATVKTENTELRHRLAETRQMLREVRTAVDALNATNLDLQDRAEGAAASLETETRRLRSRVAELEAQVADLRRAAREDKGAASTKVRLLVETAEAAAQGLRRELALPTLDVLPADTVDAVMPGAARGVDDIGRMLQPDDPALLELLLTLPRVHVVIDGYNVTKTGYPALALDEQRARLLRDLGPVAARTGAEVTVVFDGADLLDAPPVAGPRGVRVRFSPPGVIADELIRQFVAAEPQGRPVVVISTDREVATGVTASGARAVPSATLLTLLARD